MCRRSRRIKKLLDLLLDDEIAAALQRAYTRLEASDMLRGLIEAIVLTPQDGPLRIDLKGNLAAMLAAAQPPSRARHDPSRATASLAEAFGGGGRTKRSITASFANGSTADHVAAAPFRS